VVAKRITESIATPFELKGHQISVGVSIGITIYPHDDHPVDELLKHADTAMYQAKQQGGNAFHLHETAETHSTNFLP
jgi:diguanylate cyclase (GGDEF)-like protein